MHGFAYDEVNDEIVVNSPLAQAILTFRGGAGGEEPPIRVIQGTRTQILGDAYSALDKVSVDGVNNEIYLPLGLGDVRGRSSDVLPDILVFDLVSEHLVWFEDLGSETVRHALVVK